MSFNEIQKLVEASLMGLKLNPEECKGEKPGQWNLKINNSIVWIDVFNFENNPQIWYFQVMSPLLKYPDKNQQAFAEDILEINAKLYGCWICKKLDWTYFLSLREANGLDQSEVDATLDRLAFYSNDYYGKLGFKYEGSWSTNAGNAPGPNSDSK